MVLLDEIEKANPDVFNILLQVLEDGRLTDGQGRTVDFRNTVLIMTSNLGSDLITRKGAVLGFAGDQASSQAGQQDQLQDQLMRRLRESFRPEFLNRIDEIIVFSQLSQDELRQITSLQLEGTRRRLHAQGVSLHFTEAAIDWIAEHGHQPEFGARPMRRTIQREVDNQLSRMLLDGQIATGQDVTVDVRDGQLAFEPRCSTPGCEVNAAADGVYRAAGRPKRAKTSAPPESGPRASAAGGRPSGTPSVRKPVTAAIFVPDMVRTSITAGTKGDAGRRRRGRRLRRAGRSRMPEGASSARSAAIAPGTP